MIKCKYCDSLNITNNNVVKDEQGILEYVRICKDCDKIQHIFCYGHIDNSCNGLKYSEMNIFK